MNRRENASFIFACLFSLVLHVGLVFLLMNVTLRMSGSKLFASRVEPDRPVLQVHRDPRDYFSDDPVQELLNPEKITADNNRRVTQAVKDLVDKTVPSELAVPAPAATPQALAQPRDPNVNSSAPAPLPAPPGEPGSLDTTQRLLKISQPDIELPKFVSPTDEVTTAISEVNVDPNAAVDPSRIDRLLGGGGTKGAGIGPDDGVAGGTGSAPLPGGGFARASPTPLPTVPQVVPSPLPKDDKPAVHVDEAFDYKLITFLDNSKKSGTMGVEGESAAPLPGYMEVRIQPNSRLREVRALKKDVVYVVDTSSSITEKWITPVKRGIGAALESLNEGDRFNIVLFKDKASAYSPEGMADATPQNIEAARQFLNSADSSGYTDVNLALGKLLVRTVPDDRVYQIVLLSDGKPTRGSINPRDIINLITRENDLTSGIYCVGIGDFLNRELLQYMAYRNKGFVVYPDNPVRCAEAITDLAARLRYPVVKDAVFNVVGVDGNFMYPQLRRDIYQSDAVSLFGRYPVSAGQLSMRVTGTSGERRLDFTFNLKFPDAEQGDEQIMQNWAFWRLHHLYSEVTRQGETKELQKRIDDVKKQYRIKTNY